MRKISVYLILTILSGGLLAHPFYVSITTVRPNTETGTLEISLRLFLDDLEHHFELAEGTKMNFGDELIREDADEKLKAYIAEHFALKTNGKVIRTDLLGYEVAEDLIWLYIESEPVKSPHFTLKNTLLTDTFDSQSNMIHFEHNGTTESVILNKDKPQHAF